MDYGITLTETRKFWYNPANKQRYPLAPDLETFESWATKNKSMSSADLLNVGWQEITAQSDCLVVHTNKVPSGSSAKSLKNDLKTGVQLIVFRDDEHCIYYDTVRNNGLKVTDGPIETVGCAIIEKFDVPRILLVHGTGDPENDYGIPKGHSEFNEIYTLTAAREVREETGITCKPTHYLGAVKLGSENGKDVVLLGYLAVYNGGFVDEKNFYSTITSWEIDDGKFFPIPYGLELITKEQKPLLGNAMKLYNKIRATSGKKSG